MRRTAALALALLCIAGTAGAQRIQSVAPPLPRAALGDLPPATIMPFQGPSPSANGRAGTGLVIGELLASAAGALVGGFAAYKAAEAIADDSRVEGT